MVPVSVSSRRQRRMREEERTALGERLIFRAMAHQEGSRESAGRGTVHSSASSALTQAQRKSLHPCVLRPNIQQKFICGFSATAPDPFSCMVSVTEPTVLQNVLLP